MVGTDVNDNGTEERAPRVRFGQAYRDVVVDKVLARGLGEVARKTARILAISIPHDFVVETDRGVMTGEPGDWLATNHPDDDPGSDLWVISDERFQATYTLVDDLGDLPQRGDHDQGLGGGVSRATLGEVAGEAVPYVDASPEASKGRDI